MKPSLRHPRFQQGSFVRNSQMQQSNLKIPPTKIVSTLEIILFLVPLAIIGYIVSSFLLEKYTEGDRIYYSKFYNEIEFSDLFDVSDIQYANTGSREPLYGLIMWLGSGYIDNITYLSIWNSILVFLMGYMAIKYRLNAIVYPLYFTNFYLLVAMTGAERLKFSIIFLLCYICINYNIRYFFLFLAPATHLQTIILYISLIIPNSLLKSSGATKRVLKNKLIRNTIIISTIFSLFIFMIFFREYLLNKSSAYMEQDSNVAMITLLTFISAVTFRRNIIPTLSILPLILAAFILGESRINMIGFMVYFYYVITLNKSLDPAFLIIMSYLSYKSIGFVDNIIHTGNGFGIK